ncbi:DNA repair protein RecO [Aquimonas voraii]|uniref:DNA repair protein RecO n=1 Tax=Aquimonas voraii TaxID=265719 RepID=A0A1G6SRS3_9GAMM|nr:DNA repair protein RecO [Aquimonas voraii]SDD19552.1 DNA replication and repair protein RecO [Aquimonas voraii]
MSRSGSPGPRVEGEPAYVLHARPFRETSQLLEVFSAGHGRMGLLARGAKGGKGGGRAALLQPFSPLILCWQGRGELPQLVDAEPAGPSPRLLGDALMAGFYANELLVQLLNRGEAHPALFARYALLLSQLAAGDLAWPLRCFERDLLMAIGFELPLEADHAGQPIEPAARYRWLGEAGALRLGIAEQAGIAGAALLALRGDEAPPEALLPPLRRLLREELKRHLHGRSLRSWGLLAEFEALRS